jgi:L-serine deaminase
MMETFNIKRGDTSPSLLYALSPASTVLTGATVRFSMRDHQSGAVKINRAATTIVTATVNPTVRYDWVGTDTDTAGFYFAEFEVTYDGGAIETFPNADFIMVQIMEDIA